MTIFNLETILNNYIENSSTAVLAFQVNSVWKYNKDKIIICLCIINTSYYNTQCHTHHPCHTLFVVFAAL